MRAKRSDPGARDAELAARRERYASDPDLREREQERHRKGYRERAADPEYRAAYNARKRRWSRERYASDPEHRERVLRRPHGYRKHLPALIEEQGGRCGICGEPLPESLADIHVDHVFPLREIARLGALAEPLRLDPANLQAAHPACNIAKGARL